VARTTVRPAIAPARGERAAGLLGVRFRLGLGPFGLLDIVRRRHALFQEGRETREVRLGRLEPCGDLSDGCLARTQIGGEGGDVEPDEQVARLHRLAL
jgi:hypothetical protein